MFLCCMHVSSVFVGRPSIRKCKELRIELELKKEMDELLQDAQQGRDAIPAESGEVYSIEVQAFDVKS